MLDELSLNTKNLLLELNNFDDPIIYNNDLLWKKNINILLHNNLTNDFKNKIIYNIEFTKKKLNYQKNKNNCFYKYLKDINPELKKISFVKFNDYFNKLDSDLKDKLFDNFQ